jgi:hypothetical protein
MTVFTEGGIRGSLSVVADATLDAKPNYQWFRNTRDSNTGGTFIGDTSQTLTIPANLPVGTYYFYCSVGAKGPTGLAVRVPTAVAVVKVLPWADITYGPGEDDDEWKKQ